MQEGEARWSKEPASILQRQQPHKIYLTKKDKEGDSFDVNRNTGSYWRIDKNALFENGSCKPYLLYSIASQLFLAKCKLEEI